MKRILALSVVILAGCAATPQQMAAQTNWDVCRYTMGGPHSQVAQYEAQRRGLDCTPYYPGIAAQMQAQNAAISNLQRAMAPQPQPFPRQTTCSTYRLGNQLETTCR